MEKDVYSTPESELIANEGSESELASRGSRLGAAIVDTIIVVPVSLALMYLTGGFDGIQTGQEPSTGYNIAIGIANIIFFMLVNGYLLLNYGQTIGKKVIGIKIVCSDKKKAEVSHLAKRYGFYFFIAIVPLIGPILNFVNVLFIFSKSKRCLHDLIADTCVVKI